MKSNYTLDYLRKVEHDFIPCPFCGQKPTIVFSDDEGNWKDQDEEDYLQEPWSGLTFMIEHDSDGCPIEPYESDAGKIFNYWYDTPEEAVENWNEHLKKNGGMKNG